MNKKQKKWVGTGEAAKMLMMSKHTFRCMFYGTGSVYGIVPEKAMDGFHLRWPKDQIIRASIQQQADCPVMLRALEGVAQWFAEQEVDTDDERIERMYHVIQAFEGKY